MSTLPNYLPPMLVLSGEWTSFLNELYGVFRTDFKIAPPQHNGKPIRFDRNICIDGQGKEEGFWHVVTSGRNETGERIFDLLRAKRLPWAKPLMVADDVPEILVWDFNTGRSSKGIRRYIWLKPFDYALIFSKRPAYYFWITAYCVDKRGAKDLQGRYNRRL